MINYLNILLITIIICFIVDCSGFTNTWKGFILKLMKLDKNKTDAISLKPFDCSLCLSFWSSIIYLIITNSFSLILFAYSCIIALISSNISEFLFWIKDFLVTIQNLLRKITK